MAETAANLVDEFLPEVPLRQWVQTVPVPLRYLLAYDSKLLSQVAGIVVRSVFAWMSAVAKREFGLPAGTTFECGGLCVPQRFNSALALAPHLHALVADGVWALEPGATKAKFRALRAPTNAEIAHVSWVVCEQTVALLRKQGRWIDAEAEAGEDTLLQKEPLLSKLAHASISGVLLFGAKAGQRVLRLFGAAAKDKADHDDRQRNGYGFDLHANSRAPARDKMRRERMCRYLLRPPLSNDRLSRLADGRYCVRLKSAWSDGTTAIILDGLELMGRLSVLIPPPRVHLIRYFGVLAPRSRLRAQVVRRRRNSDIKSGGADGTNHAGPKGRRLGWAYLLKRVFELDLYTCQRCKRQGIQRISVITDPNVIRAILSSMAKKAADS